jgi:hypothetical protein
MKPTELFGIDPDFVAAPSDYEQGRIDERKRIRAGVEVLAMRTHDLTEDWRGAVLAVVDGTA